MSCADDIKVAITADNLVTILGGVVDLGGPVAPGKMPVRGEGKGRREFAACTTCGLVGHKADGHLELELGRRVDWVVRHVGSMVKGAKRMSPAEVWCQISIYPRMLRGYLEAYQNREPVDIGEVNVVYDGFKCLWPNGDFPLSSPARETCPNRRYAKFLKELDIYGGPLHVHAETSDIWSFDETIVYTKEYVDTVTRGFPFGMLERLRDLRPLYADANVPSAFWMADDPDLGGGASCKRCGLLGHNRGTCSRLTWATKIMLNVASAVLDRMDDRVRVGALRNSWLGLVRLLVSEDHTSTHSISADRLDVPKLTSHDLVLMYNTALRVRGVSTRVVRMSDVARLVGLRMAGVGGTRGGEVVKSEVGEARGRISALVRACEGGIAKLPDPEFFIAEWGVTTCIIDYAAGLVALSRKFTLSDRVRQSILSSLNAYYHRGYMRGLDAFNQQIGVIEDTYRVHLKISDQEWYEALNQLMDRSKG